MDVVSITAYTPYIGPDRFFPYKPLEEDTDELSCPVIFDIIYEYFFARVLCYIDNGNQESVITLINHTDKFDRDGIGRDMKKNGEEWPVHYYTAKKAAEFATVMRRASNDPYTYSQAMYFSKILNKRIRTISDLMKMRGFSKYIDNSEKKCTPYDLF